MLMLLRDYRRGIEQNDKSFVGLANPEVEGRRFKSGFWDSKHTGAGWSSLVARRAHNPKVVGSNPAPATNFLNWLTS